MTPGGSASASRTETRIAIIEAAAGTEEEGSEEAEMTDVTIVETLITIPIRTSVLPGTEMKRNNLRAIKLWLLSMDY